MSNLTMASPTTCTIGQIVAFSVLVVMNLIGNSLVLLIVLKNRSMRIPTNYLLVNLSIADIMVAISVSIQYIFGSAYEQYSGELSDYLCRFVTGGNFTWVGTAASVFCLVVIAAERYDAIVIRRRNSRLEGYGLAVTISCCWLFAILLNLPLFLYLGFNGQQEGQNKCKEYWPTATVGKVYSVVCFAASGFIPLTIMVVFYSRIVYTLWARPIVATGYSEVVIIESRKKVTRLLIIVSVMYGFCRFPNLFMYLLGSFPPNVYRYGSTLYIVSVALVCLNSTMNPFLYSLHSQKYRKHIRSLVCRKRNAGFIDTSENNSRGESALLCVAQDSETVSALCASST